MTSISIPTPAAWWRRSRMLVPVLLAAGWARARRARRALLASARRPISALLELAGCAAVAKGAFVLAPWLGWLVVGGVLVVLGVLLEPRAPKAEAG